MCLNYNYTLLLLIFPRMSELAELPMYLSLQIKTRGNFCVHAHDDRKQI